VVFVGAGLVIMPRTIHVHEVELVDNAKLFERFERAVDGCEMQAGHLLLSTPQKLRRVEVLASLLKDLSDYPALRGQAEPAFVKFAANRSPLWEVFRKNHF
jgi:hypothetical protein